jgi:hypothetical protein
VAKKILYGSDLNVLQGVPIAMLSDFMSWVYSSLTQPVKIEEGVFDEQLESVL